MQTTQYLLIARRFYRRDGNYGRQKPATDLPEILRHVQTRPHHELAGVASSPTHQFPIHASGVSSSIPIDVWDVLDAVSVFDKFQVRINVLIGCFKVDITAERTRNKIEQSRCAKPSTWKHRFSATSFGYPRTLMTTSPLILTFFTTDNCSR